MKGPSSTVEVRRKLSKKQVHRRKNKDPFILQYMYFFFKINNEEEEAKTHFLRYLIGVLKKQVSRKSVGRDTTSSCKTSSLCSGIKTKEMAGADSAVQHRPDGKSRELRHSSKQDS